MSERNNNNNAVVPLPQPVSFTVEHFDPVAEVVKTYVLTYFPDGRLQMVDGKTGKVFLSKTYTKEIAPIDLYIGNTIVVCARQLSIVGYANDSTHKYFESRQERAFVLVLLSLVIAEKRETALGEIVSTLQNIDGSGEERRKLLGNRGLAVIAKAEMFLCCGDSRQHHRPEIIESSLENVLPPHQTGNVVALEIIMDSTDGGFQGLIGVIDQLRRRYGGKSIFASRTPEEAAEHARYVFHERGLMPPSSATSNRFEGLDWNNDTACTLCVVKPHVVHRGGLGAVLSLIGQHGFKVTRLQMLSLTDAEADELLLPYRGVVSYHAEALRHIKSAPCVALQIEGGSGVVEDFREACGPADPEVARELRPDSIRAHFGKQQATNAVHCTDLREDGHLECQFMLGLVARRRH